eukprot:scaffold6577_cov175-Amphora_coffeaeformis.AAC.6
MKLAIAARRFFLERKKRNVHSKLRRQNAISSHTAQDVTSDCSSYLEETDSSSDPGELYQDSVLLGEIVLELMQASAFAYYKSILRTVVRESSDDVFIVDSDGEDCPVATIIANRTRHRTCLVFRGSMDTQDWQHNLDCFGVSFPTPTVLKGFVAENLEVHKGFHGTDNSCDLLNSAEALLFSLFFCNFDCIGP